MAYVASMIIKAHIQSKRVLIDDCSQCQAIVKKREVTWVICRNIKPGRQKDYDYSCLI